MRATRHKIFISLLLLVTVAIISGCVGQSTNANNPSGDYLYYDPISVSIYSSEEPLLNREVDLIFNITTEVTDIDSPNTTIKVFLPGSIVVTSGSLDWNVSLIANETISKKITVKIMKEGQSEMRLYIPVRYISNKNYFFYIYSTEDSGNISREPFVDEKVPLWQTATQK